jgi:hypothetical protein
LSLNDDRVLEIVIRLVEDVVEGIVIGLTITRLDGLVRSF